MNCMYCRNCGVILSENARFCGVCGERAAGGKKAASGKPGSREADGGETESHPESARKTGGRVGYSDKINDPAFARYVKNTKRWAGIFSIFIAVAAVVGFFIAGQMEVEGMENPQSLFIGMVIGGMFLLIGLFTILGRKRTRTWDGVVVDKKIKKKKRDQGNGGDYVRYLEYSVIVQENGGKKHSITVDDDDTVYKYYEVGDKVRHHAGLNSYEKYDKSRDNIIFCNACATLCGINDDYCWRCKCPLLK